MVNIRGLGGKKKSRAVFDWLDKKLPVDIYFLQETHSSIQLLDTWRGYWKGEIYCAHGDKNKRGVAILFHQGIQHEVVELIEDAEGRFLIINIKIGDETFVLVNCYSPTKNKELQQRATLKRLVDTLV